MLKAKKGSYNSRGKAAAMKAICREDNVKGLHAIIPKALHKKMKMELNKLDLTFQAWVIEKIEEM